MELMYFQVVLVCVSEVMISVSYLRGDVCIRVDSLSSVGSAVHALPRLALGSPGGAAVQSAVWETGM